MSGAENKSMQAALFSRNWELPHRIYGSKHWQPLYADPLSSTFLTTKDHNVLHFACLMTQFSA